MPKRALILCNGQPPSRSLARRVADTCDYIICADGGANIALRLGIRPDVIIGDMDSILTRTRRAFTTSTIIHIPRQDNTDLEKALDFISARKIKKIFVLGATGKRIDFTLGNLSVIWKYSSFLDITFVGEDWIAIPIGHKKTFRTRRRTTVSLIPFGKCSGITLKGLQFPLSNATMRIGEIGVSNVVLRSPFSVSVKKGNMLLIVMGVPVIRRGKM